MITIINEDIFTTKADILVNPVNCVGVMGGGLAAQFRYNYPKMYKDYRHACFNFSLRIGTIHIWKQDSQWIINLPTKEHWINPSKYEYVEQSLIALREYLQKQTELTIAIPALGCGLGGLEWDKVTALIHKYLGDLSHINIKLIGPQ